MTTLCYYGLTMVASDLSDDLFLNFILVLMVEIPANLFCTYAMGKFGRKKCLSYSQILAGVSCIAAGFLVDYDPRIPVSFQNTLDHFESKMCNKYVWISTFWPSLMLFLRCQNGSIFFQNLGPDNK